MIELIEHVHRLLEKTYSVKSDELLVHHVLISNEAQAAERS